MKVMNNVKSSSVIQISDVNDVEAKNKKEFKIGRVFGYALNEKRAKRNLLKGAKKQIDLEVEVKSGNTNLRFSDGSYYEVVLPLLRSWQEKINEPHYFSENEIKIVEFEAGKDISEKHVDTKLAVMFNDNRLVLHAYNSTQNLMG